jgi:O-antigen ligase
MIERLLLKKDFAQLMSLEKLAGVSVIASCFFTPISPFPSHIFLSLLILCVLLSSELRESVISAVRLPSVQLAGALFGLLALSLVYTSVDSSHALHILHKYDKLLYLPFIICAAYHKEARKAAIQAFILALVIIASLTIFKTIGLINIKPEAATDTVFHNHIYTSYMMALGAYFCVLMISENKKSYFFYATMLMIMLFQLLFINEGRTGYFVLGALIILGFWQQFAFKGLFMAAVSLLVLSFSIYFIAPVFQQRVASAISETDTFIHESAQHTSIGIRLLFATHSMELIKQKPMLGYGIAAFKKEYYQAYPKDYPITEGLGGPHNEFLHIAFQTGMLGLFIFLTWLLQLFWVSYTLPLFWRHTLQAVVVAFMAGACCDEFLMLSSTGFSLILLAGVCLAAGDHQFIKNKMDNKNGN